MRILLTYYILFTLNSVLLSNSTLVNQSVYRFKKIGIEDGLSQTSVLSIEQDTRGYMWFGTATGLNRYDGYEFVVYYNELTDSLSISDNKISALYEDKSGVLWIGTSEGILNKFNARSETFTHFDIAKSSDWYSSLEVDFYTYPLTFSRHENSTITSISQDKNGNLWIGTWGKGLVKFNPITEEKKYYYYFKNRKNSLSSNKIVNLLVDSDNVLWIGTFGGGLNRIKLNETESDDIIIERFVKDSEFLFGDKITAIFEDSEKDIWIGSYLNGISIIDYEDKNILKKAESITISEYSPDLNKKIELKNIMSITQDQNSIIWVATYGNGLFSVSKNTWQVENFLKEANNPNSLGVNELQSLYVDNSGVLWIGTQLGSGINKLETGLRNFNIVPVSTEPNKSLNDNILWAICEDNDQNIWIGTHRGGVNKWNRKKNEFTYFTKDKFLNDNHIRAIELDQKGNLWIGTYSGGLSFFETSSSKFTHFLKSDGVPGSLSSNQIQALLSDGDSVLWIGTFGGGLNKLNLKEFYSEKKARFISYIHHPTKNTTISDNRVYDLFKDSKNILWIGTHGGGLNKFNHETGIFTRYRFDELNKNSISDDRILSIHEMDNKDLLIGTFGGGLNRFLREDESFERLNEKLQLNCSDVYGILDDENGYWLSTDNGIFKIDKNLQSFRNYDLNDGLQSLEFSGGAYYKGSDGTYYFGGINGLNYFTPSNITLNEFAPPIVISKIRVFNEPIKGEHEFLTFDKDENYFSFEFASLDYQNSRKNKYKYILEGLDSKWSFTDSENRKVFYTNLDPGEYRFKVMGSNKDGVWSPYEAKVSITILAPFWMRWWFIAGLILLIGAIITFFINQRIRYLVALDKLKTNIAADLHDNVGAGLTEISILSELSANLLDKPKNAVKHIQQISELSRQLVESMSDIVWVVNPSRDSLYDLIVRLKDMYGELLADLNISLVTSNLNTLESIRLPMDYRQNLYLILKESINNSIKHSKCSKIELFTYYDKNELKIELHDNGIGFEFDKVNSGEGLKNIKERGKNIGGRVKIISGYEKGTTVEFIGKIN